MKKIYILSLLLACSLSFGQAFTATYDFALVTAASGLIDPSVVPTAPGIVMGSFSAVNPTSLNSTAGGRFSIANQPLGATNADDATFTGAIDTGIYFQVTLTPNAGTTFNLSNIVFNVRRSGTGIRNYAVRSSADSYASNLSASISPANTNLVAQPSNNFFWALDATSTAADQIGSTITLTGASFTGRTTPITFRFYGWNAEAVGGSFSIDNVAISGNTTVLSTKQFDGISGLSIYPNPAKNILNITSDSFETKTVSIYNVLGKVVLTANVTNAPLNIANLAKGVYVVKVTEADKTATRKLVIE
jgi:Secretion system C-terminal sorting domain